MKTLKSYMHFSSPLTVKRIPYEDYVSFMSECGIEYKVPKDKYIKCSSTCINFYRRDDDYTHCRLNNEYLPNSDRTLVCKTILMLAKKDK